MYAKKGTNAKVGATLLAIVLLIGCTAGATFAWLMMKTDPVVNTFTTSNVSIELTETVPQDRTQIKMVPGATISKNPKVTVLANSEACYLFVKVEASNTADYITYDIAEGWTLVSGETNVYFREHEATGTAAGTPISILASDQVIVKNNVTKTMMTSASSNLPKLTFTAYAIQKHGFTSPEAAWTEANSLG